MGVEHYIVEPVNQRVLDLHKSYWLYEAADKNGQITLESLRACPSRDDVFIKDDCPTWEKNAILSWMEAWCEGRPVFIVHDAAHYYLWPWRRSDWGPDVDKYPEDFTYPWGMERRTAGWRLWSLFGLPGEPWPPESKEKR